MDPNETLRWIRNAVAQAEKKALTVAGIDALCEAITDLDEWLSKGGFLPAAWERKNL